MSRRNLMVKGGLSVAALTFLGAGCGEGAGGAATTAQADAASVQGKIRFDTYEDWIGPDTIADFEKEFPDASVRSDYYFFPGDRVATFLADGSSSSDMMLMELLWLGALIENDAVAKLDLSAIPNYERIDSRFKVGPFSDEEALGVVVDTGRYGIAYREDLVDFPITSWSDFFEMADQHPGRFALEDYSALGISASLAAQGLPMRSTDPGEIQQAQDLLVDKKSNLGPLWQNTPVRGLLTGEFYAASIWDLQGPSAVSKNDSVRWVFPEDGVLSWYEGWIGIAGSDVLPAVQAFMNFALEPKNYAAFVNATGVSNLMPSADQFVDPTIRESEILSPSPDVVERTVPQEYLGGAQRLYDDAWSSFKAS